MGLTLLVYSSLLLGVMVIGLPYWLARMLGSGRYRAGLAGRLGRVPAELRAACAEAHGAGKPVVWLHAVSVGEVLAATRLVGALQAAGFAVAVSTTTETGQALARERFAGSPVFYLPLDFGALMRRYLRVLRPRLVVLMESELWPNMIHECHKAGVPLAVANARVSDRSFPRYMKLKRLWGPLLREVTVFLGQSEETAERLRAMGVATERVMVAGNLKYDVRAAMMTGERRLLSRRMPAGVVVGVCGSTLEGEEALLLEAWKAVWAVYESAVLVIAPRHPARFDEVARLMAATRRVVVRVSALEDAILPGSVVLLDTIGDLASTYALGTVAFVGGSLVAKGGHNPLEPAQFGVPVVMGYSYENFREIVEGMREANAIRIARSEELGPVLSDLGGSGPEAKALGERGRIFFERQAGATERVMAELMRLVR